MNKKITLYELMGLVKDGQAPKRIKYEDKIYYYFSNKCDLYKYETMPTEFQRSLSLILDNMYLNLNDEVEILEEEKKIEKLEIAKITDDNFNGLKESINVLHKDIENKINEIINEINSHLSK